MRISYGVGFGSLLLLLSLSVNIAQAEATSINGLNAVLANGLDTAITTDGSWHEFGFGLAGTFAFTCGGACVSTVNPVAEDISAPPWTFTGPGVVSLTDLFARGDRFELFDAGVPVGSTSVPTNDGLETCPSSGSDILACLADPTYSHGVFAVGAGAHSLTIEVIQNAEGTDSGAAVFQLASASVPEPGTVTLFGAGLVAFGLLLRRRTVVISRSEESAG
jgi:hypothetical protein